MDRSYIFKQTLEELNDKLTVPYGFQVKCTFLANLSFGFVYKLELFSIATN